MRGRQGEAVCLLHDGPPHHFCFTDENAGFEQDEAGEGVTRVQGLDIEWHPRGHPRGDRLFWFCSCLGAARLCTLSQLGTAERHWQISGGFLVSNRGHEERDVGRGRGASRARDGGAVCP